MNILIATDGSASAAAAVEFAATFPFPDGTSFTLMSVVPRIEHRAEALDARHLEVLDATDKAAVAEAESMLAGQALLLDEAGRPGSTEVRIGHPAEEIVKAAEATAADIVVVGSHGLTGVKRYLIGSVSNQVLQSAHCSVLIVKQSEDVEPGSRVPPPHDGRWRLLVAYDDSIQAMQAVEFCSSLAFDDSAQVELLTVLPVVTMFRQEIRQELDEIWRQTTEADKAALADAAERIGSATPNVSTVLVESGDVGDAILDAADRFDAHLIIMGDKGKGAVARFLMGSATPRVAHHSKRSVLTIRTRK